MGENQLPIVARIPRAGEGGEAPLGNSGQWTPACELIADLLRQSHLRWKRVHPPDRAIVLTPNSVQRFVRTEPLTGGCLRYRLGPATQVSRSLFDEVEKLQLIDSECLSTAF